MCSEQRPLHESSGCLLKVKNIGKIIRPSSQKVMVGFMTVQCLVGLTNSSPIQLHFLLVNRQKEHKRPYFFSVKFTSWWKTFTVVSNTVTKQVLMISTLTHSLNGNQNWLLMDLHTKVINMGGGQITDPMDSPHGLWTTLKWTTPLNFGD